ncbi:hypothetical protein DN069_32940 [Streptacidiphilus pinicola]|uniref:UspA domain-containing protein n=1 Tax=Streptacidiphilus pinicola TaxID=2219663 RepID=A0A2X0IUV9_9ACTN|nr:hypothetical protein [Streptacidiphilus pinicola]RAG81386.1 hypothetical protein DN069_32940 [Streptacidiphilus pinicola]
MSETATAAVTARVIVGVRDSAKGRAQLRRAAAEARRQGAELVPVLAWSPSGGELLYRARPCPELAHAWERRACAKLDEVVTETLAAEQLPAAVRPVTVRAESLAEAVTATATAPTDQVFAPAERPGLLTRLGFYHHTPNRGVALAH